MRKYAKLICGRLAQDAKLIVGDVDVCDLIPVTGIDLRLTVGDVSTATIRFAAFETDAECYVDLEPIVDFLRKRGYEVREPAL